MLMRRKIMQKKTVWLAAAIGVFAASLEAQTPSIAAGGILNAASYAYSGLPNSAIAQGSLFIVYGTALGPATLMSAAYPLPTTLGGTSMSATVGGVTVKPYIFYTSAGQVVGLMPSNTPA